MKRGYCTLINIRVAIVQPAIDIRPCAPSSAIFMIVIRSLIEQNSVVSNKFRLYSNRNSYTDRYFIEVFVGKNYCVSYFGETVLVFFQN